MPVPKSLNGINAGNSSLLGFFVFLVQKTLQLEGIHRVFCSLERAETSHKHLLHHFSLPCLYQCNLPASLFLCTACGPFDRVIAISLVLGVPVDVAIHLPAADRRHNRVSQIVHAMLVVLDIFPLKLIAAAVSPRSRLLCHR